MIFGRNKCVMNNVGVSKKVLAHDEFIDRIRKTLYFGDMEEEEDDLEVSRPLADYASELFSEPHKGHSLNRLTSVAASSVHATPCSLIMALIYLDRLNVSDPSYVRRITPQELFIVSMMISTKFYAGHDEEIYLSDWADDGNLTEDRLKQLELEFLCAIDWNIYISNEQFFTKLTSIEKSLARREGLRRGWLTYTELMQMLPSFTLAKFLLNNITVMAVSYAASVMTIAGAFFLASQIPGHALHRKTTTGGVAVGEMSELLEETTLLPAPQDLHNHTRAGSVVIGSGKQRNATIRPSNGITTSTSSSASTASCIALNVEMELLKLERQYREEAVREDLRMRNNEIASDSRLTLPDAVQEMKKGKESGERSRHPFDTQQRNWLAMKAGYSDGVPNKDALFSPQNERRQHFPCFADCIADLGNCTSSLFWQLLVDASFVRLPTMWFKFM